MSHNPVTPGLLDVLDTVGVVAMDETRELHSDPISIMNMGAMVKRDRNHASVVIWSYCNEGGCGSAGAPEFRAVTKGYDPTRPTLGNHYGIAGMDNTTDVEGFSHKKGDIFDSYHEAHPTRPMFASECCSCSSSRSPQSAVAFGNGTSMGVDFSAESCTASQSNASNGREFVSGTMVWTLFDYYGESHGWPRVSSAYGQFDLAGFQKFTARWYLLQPIIGSWICRTLQFHRLN
jgi:beta-galactosidase/beta-glucuronidase